MRFLLIAALMSASSITVTPANVIKYGACLQSKDGSLKCGWIYRKSGNKVCIKDKEDGEKYCGNTNMIYSNKNEDN